MFERKNVSKCSLFLLYLVNARWDQTGFHICCARCFALQNGKKTFEKKAFFRVKTTLGLLNSHVIFDDFPVKKYVIPGSFQY